MKQKFRTKSSKSHLWTFLGYSDLWFLECSEMYEFEYVKLHNLTFSLFLIIYWTSTGNCNSNDNKLAGDGIWTFKINSSQLKKIWEILRIFITCQKKFMETHTKILGEVQVPRSCNVPSGNGEISNENIDAPGNTYYPSLRKHSPIRLLEVCPPISCKR